MTQREHPIVLLDTNIWIDNYLADRPSADESRRFIAEARQNGFQLTYAVHCLNDVFLIIQQHLKHDARVQGRELSNGDVEAIREVAWACVENMRALATAIGADESDAWRACRYRSLTGDLEDNFVLAAAERVPVDFIVTNDKQLLKKSTVNAYRPEDALTVMALQLGQANSKTG